MKKETITEKDVDKAIEIAEGILSKGEVPREKALRLGLEVMADTKGVVVRMISPDIPPIKGAQPPKEKKEVELDPDVIVDFFSRMRDTYGLSKLFIDNYPLVVGGLASYANKPSVSTQELELRIEAAANFPEHIRNKVFSLLREEDVVRFYRVILPTATVSYLCIDNGKLAGRVEDGYTDCIGIEYTFTTHKPIYDKNKEHIADELSFEFLIVTGLQDERVKATNLPSIVQHEFVHGMIDMIFAQMYELEDYRAMLGEDGLYYLVEFLCDFVPHDKISFNRYSVNPLDEMVETLPTYPEAQYKVYEKIIEALRPYYADLIPEK